MLVLSRRTDEAFTIQTPAGPITIWVNRVQTTEGPKRLANPRVYLGIEAPDSYNIVRNELL